MCGKCQTLEPVSDPNILVRWERCAHIGATDHEGIGRAGFQKKQTDREGTLGKFGRDGGLQGLRGVDGVPMGCRWGVPEGAGRGHTPGFHRCAKTIENISRIRMVVARASGTLIASSLKQNTFLTLRACPARPKVHKTVFAARPSVEGPAGRHFNTTCESY